MTNTGSFAQPESSSSDKEFNRGVDSDRESIISAIDNSDFTNPETKKLLSVSLQMPPILQTKRQATPVLRPVRTDFLRPSVVFETGFIFIFCE